MWWIIAIVYLAIGAFCVGAAASDEPLTRARKIASIVTLLAWPLVMALGAGVMLNARVKPKGAKP
jgi:hypothetical protein